MKQKKLVMSFSNERGDVVPELSKDPARGEDVMAAMSFLDIGRSIMIEVVEFDVPSPKH